ncbi:MAG: DUF6427 family protein [Spirosomataceae bacterium]
MNFPFPLLTSELEWILLGEKIYEGKVLYQDILTQISPLSAYFYAFFYSLFGRDFQTMELVALFIGLLQALYFTYLTQTRQILSEKNYLPGLIYLIALHACFDMNKISPALIGNTFVLMTINHVLKQLEYKQGVKDDIIEVGIYLGLATLFYQAYWVLLFWVILSLFMFSSMNARQLLLLLIGFSLPILAFVLYYYFSDNTGFSTIWLQNFIQFKLFPSQDWLSIFRSFALFVFLLIAGVLRMLRGTRYSNYQVRVQQTLLILGIFSGLTIFIAPAATPMYLVVLVPVFAFFITGLFIHLKGTLIPELYFLVFLLLSLFIYFQGSGPLIGTGFQELAHRRLSKSQLPEVFKGQRVLILGSDIAEYQEAEVATQYLDWSLAKGVFEEVNNYESLVTVFDTFSSDPPTIVIDKINLMPTLMKKIPLLAQKYTPLQKYPGYYQLR